MCPSSFLFRQFRAGSTSPRVSRPKSAGESRDRFAQIKPVCTTPRGKYRSGDRARGACFGNQPATSVAASPSSRLNQRCLRRCDSRVDCSEPIPTQRPNSSWLARLVDQRRGTYGLCAHQGARDRRTRISRNRTLVATSKIWVREKTRFYVGASTE